MSYTAFKNALSSKEECAYALLRIVSGAMITFHGVQKIFGFFSTRPQPELFSQLWIGGALELICGVAITIGLFTRINAFLASGMLAVAYFQFHWKFQFDSAFFPAINKGELAALYSFVFLYIACRGAGKHSIGKD